MAASGVVASLFASWKADSGRGDFGIRIKVSAITPTGNVSTMSTAGSDQMVERRLITPTVASRKWPGVAISSGALDDRPNCHTAPAADTAARRNGKSTGCACARPRRRSGSR